MLAIDWSTYSTPRLFCTCGLPQSSGVWEIHLQYMAPSGSLQLWNCRTQHKRTDPPSAHSWLHMLLSWLCRGQVWPTSSKNWALLEIIWACEFLHLVWKVWKAHCLTEYNSTTLQSEVSAPLPENGTLLVQFKLLLTPTFVYMYLKGVIHEPKVTQARGLRD